MAGGIEFLDFPAQLADQLGIPLFAGQILASILVLMFPLLPTLAYTKNGMALMIVGLAALAFPVALGWFPIWVFAIICLTIALMYGKAILGVFGGD